jgi:hypothetical protein
LSDDVAELLLARGGDITLRGGGYADHLLDDARKGDGVIVRLHLEIPGSMGAKSYALNTALSSAVTSIYGLNRQLLKLLLKAWAASPLQKRDTTSDITRLLSLSSAVGAKIESKKRKRSRRHSV